MAADLYDCSVMEHSSSSCSPFPPRLSPSKEPEFWNRMEEATREIIEHVHPTLVSEERRRDVIDYMQRFIKTRVGCEVHSFGSVPLKTYLPDGDIDLTAFGGPWSDEELAQKVFTVLKNEIQNVDAEFIIKDVKLIRAEVKLVTCLVQNLVVDISFNQLGGICTLSFLEKIDQLIGKDHLFKRSIILIKAWCYYESHILGAVHGLISTYALETLVLYIFHLFHSSLDGPLSVLYKFLDYFSKFDWDKYCISLNGPVCLSSLPEFVVETPENGGQDLLLTSEFLNGCMEMYTVPPRGFETNQRVFTSKYLNVVDPLKENNNLGRSVNKANFYRVRTAFTYGARKLGQIILQSEEDISSELRKFFSNMLHRHGKGQRPDVLDAVRYISPASAANHFQMVYDGRHEQEHLLCAGANVSRTATSVSEEQVGGDAKEFATVRIQRHEISDHVRDKERVSPLNGKHPNFLSDLTGDNDSQLNSLRYGRWWLDYVQNGHMSPQWTQFPNNNPWEVFPHPLPFTWNAPGLVNADGFHMNPHVIPDANFGLEELPKLQGIGTYFPNVNHYRDEPFFSRRNSRRNNGRSMAHLPSEMNLVDGNTRERHHHLHHRTNQTNGPCDMSQSGILGSFSGTTNEPINHPNEPLPAEVLYHPEGSQQSDITTSIPSSSMQEARVTARKSYHLTDDQDFPPL
ncbi:unnamed protein product [Eruca vesicaria subsp. sativa]|uniref:Polymerase nucleotidyl transferase domain-containing protein n=1 Tax=Eruca vesicaria subsp. sativa TaxID=29727 RepID=A0ABC8M099_ERUVS|nr:unnamed protein product [Eruca vesicaria subsp. sativa]